MEGIKQTVFVGLSGGVDSAVSAALLETQGYHVVGVFIKTWHPDFLECTEEEERHDAMRVAAHLDIPFLTFDLSEVYRKKVADYMIREYQAGRTPNPDVVCNKEVKFGVFLKKALSLGADLVATGHYAKNVFTKSPDLSLPSVVSPRKHFLLRGKDLTKDQTYFLWTLTQKELSKILFPVGDLKKTEVRNLAQKFKLPVARKKDGQGICFLGAIDLKGFLKHFIKEKRGRVVNKQGEVIGYHDGVHFYTLGERRGFTITTKSPVNGPYYIIKKDVRKNILVVTQGKSRLGAGHPSYAKPVGENQEENLGEKNIKIEYSNWVTEIPKEHKKYTAQIRYHGELLPCQITSQTRGAGHGACVSFEKPVLVAPGQSVVLYDRGVCLGGGVVV